MLARPLALAVALALGSCSSPAPAPQPVAAPEQALSQPPTPAAPAQTASELMRERLEASLTPYLDGMGSKWGAAFAWTGLVHVTRGGDPVYSQARGLADRAAGRKIDSDTSFRVGSVTKQFTAAAILELEEQGELKVSDTIRAHLPDYPAPIGDQVTIHHLLTHTSGIPSYTSNAEVMKTADRRRTVAEMLALFADQPLEFEPGSEFAYSNSGYIVLGAIIEKVSGESYGAFVTKTLFEPAGLLATAYGDDPENPNRALGYAVDDSEQLAPARAIDMSVPYAAGGIRSTAADLARWDRALQGGSLLGPESLRKLYTPALKDYAYGWRVTRVGGKQVIAHGGGIFGFNTSYIRIPEDELVVVVWTNNEALSSSQVADAALLAMSGEPIPPRSEVELAAPDPALAKRISGGYVLAAASRTALAAIGLDAELLDSIAAAFIRSVGGALFFDPIGQDRARIHLRAAADGSPPRFVIKGARVEIEIELPTDAEGEPAEGAATALLVHQGGLAVRYERDPRRAAKLEADWKKLRKRRRRR